MVKKLYKHEFRSHLRILWVVWAALLAISAGARIVQFFEADSIPYKIISTTSFVTYGVAILAAFAFTSVLGIIRFYKNLFTSEGYLSFTLPVTTSQHIWVKAVSVVCMEVLTFLVVLLSGCVLTSGEMLVELWKAMVYLVDLFCKVLGIHGPILIAEYVILLVVTLFASVLLHYTFISIGQLFRKNRILATVGVYFVYYILSQMLSTAFYVFFSLFSLTPAFEKFFLWYDYLFTTHPYATLHSILWIAIVVQAITVLVEFWVVKLIITKKLNLE